MSYERSRDVDTFPASWCPSFSSPSVAQNPSLSMDLKDFRRPYCSTKMFVFHEDVFKVNFILGEDFN